MILQAAIIGCGNMAGGYDERGTDEGCYTHAGGYRRVANVELVAAADPDRTRLERFGGYWGIRHLYDDCEELLRSQRPEVISVCTPDDLHESTIRRILEIRPPRVIFSEKPLALSRRSARLLLDQARSAGSVIVVNSQRRCEEGHRRMRTLIQEGGIGKVAAVVVHYVKGLYHVGVTAVDTLRFLVSEVESVRALDGDHQSTPPCDPSVDAVLYLRNGATAVMLGVDRYGYRYSLFEIDIIGTEGRIRILENGDKMELYGTAEYRHYAGFSELRRKTENAIPTRMGEAIPNAIRELLPVAHGEGSVQSMDGEEAYKDLCVIDAIAESKEQEGKRVWVQP